ncbi:Peptidyl-dipeptidase dcp [Pantoea agglomerans]|uniref:Peptidyl-dipeptidase dcp n=1 Tax=Enterobacter agglomerans TaxID=549 RepID=A0A379AG07_ENTAG|nr:Peptidyl-dipeptidase dcp [Pantoea agglomerans]
MPSGSYRIRWPKTPKAALAFMHNIVPAARGRAEREAAAIQQTIDQQQGDFTPAGLGLAFFMPNRCGVPVTIWMRARLSPYFELNSVLQNGVFWAATQLYGIRFTPRQDLPVYHPDVQVYEIFDADETPLALFYTDFFKRDSKGGGAWMSNFVNQSTLLDSKPVIYNVL